MADVERPAAEQPRHGFLDHIIGDLRAAPVYVWIGLGLAAVAVIYAVHNGGANAGANGTNATAPAGSGGVLEWPQTVGGADTSAGTTGATGTTGTTGPDLLAGLWSKLGIATPDAPTMTAYDSLFSQWESVAGIAPNTPYGDLTGQQQSEAQQFIETVFWAAPAQQPGASNSTPIVAPGPSGGAAAVVANASYSPHPAVGIFPQLTPFHTAVVQPR